MEAGRDRVLRSLKEERSPTALFLAARIGDLELVKTAHAMDRNVPEFDQGMAWEGAAASGHRHVLEYLRSWCLTQKNLSLALADAAGSGDVELMRELIAWSRDCPPGWAALDFTRALNRAANKGHLPALELCIQLGRPGQPARPAHHNAKLQRPLSGGRVSHCRKGAREHTVVQEAANRNYHGRNNQAVHRGADVGHAGRSISKKRAARGYAMGGCSLFRFCCSLSNRSSCSRSCSSSARSAWGLNAMPAGGTPAKLPAATAARRGFSARIKLQLKTFSKGRWRSVMKHRITRSPAWLTSRPPKVNR